MWHAVHAIASWAPVRGNRRAWAPWLKIVGVARDSKYQEVSEDPTPHHFLPGPQHPEFVSQNEMTLIVRATGRPQDVTSAIQRAVAAIDSRLPVFDVGTMSEVLQDALATPRMALTLLALFSTIALVLAATGTYGTVSYAVSLRTHEVGIRRALGASSANVLRLVIRQGMTAATIGMAIGLAAAIGLGRLLSSLLFGVSATDSLTFGVASAVLFSVALVASYLAARRVTSVNPMIALRGE